MDFSPTLTRHSHLMSTACRHTTKRRKNGSTARDGGWKLRQWDVDDFFNDALWNALWWNQLEHLDNFFII